VVSYVFKENIDHVFDCLFVGSLGLESSVPDRGRVLCGQGNAESVQVIGHVFLRELNRLVGVVQEETVSKIGGGWAVFPVCRSCIMCYFRAHEYESVGVNWKGGANWEQEIGVAVARSIVKLLAEQDRNAKGYAEPA
jgi:hypothetical protein